MEICRICNINYVVAFMACNQVAHISDLKSHIIRALRLNCLDTSSDCGIIIFTYYAIAKEVHMAPIKPILPKEKALRESGTLNTHPVTDALFSNSDFFDPRDLVQVKYEMLRKVNQEGQSINQTSAAFGFSRPSFYKVLADYEREGITGLLPRKRGPHGGHKLTDEVLEFVKGNCSTEHPMSIPELLCEVEKHFELRIHRRSLERAIKRFEKKTPQVARKE
jgi:transposase